MQTTLDSATDTNNLSFQFDYARSVHGTQVFVSKGQKYLDELNEKRKPWPLLNARVDISNTILGNR